MQYLQGTRRCASTALLVAMASVIAAPAAGAEGVTTTKPGCRRPILVVAAMPLELNPLVAVARLDPTKTVRRKDRTFYVGELGRAHVVLTMSGIGLVNAAETTSVAFDAFRCPFAGVVFSGVAGSRHNIGDVTVPARWTLDDGRTWMPADPKMLRVAEALRGSVPGLAQEVPVGDAACLCPGVDHGTAVRMPQAPRVYVGGDGMSSDTFGDHALPCLPGGGDIAGCSPCLASSAFGADAAAFAAHAPELADPGFVAAFLRPPAATTETMEAQDEETAAVAKVARGHRVPFLGVRAASDGHGDPLHLPGFPSQFFAYRQLAADNAAAVTIAFLQRWSIAR